MILCVQSASKTENSMSLPYHFSNRSGVCCASPISSSWKQLKNNFSQKNSLLDLDAVLKKNEKFKQFAKISTKFLNVENRKIQLSTDIQ